MTTRPAAHRTRRDVTRDGILAAALRCFSRHGYRRTSMERVATEAGISRAAVYLHFDNKDSLFRALVEGLHEQALTAAAAAVAGSGSLRARLEAFFEAKSVRLFALLAGSEHAEEFLGENHRLCGDVSAAAAARSTRLLVRLLATADRAGEITLSSAGLTAQAAAELLLDTAEGIKSRARATMSADAYRRRIHQALGVLVDGLAPPASVRRRSSGAKRG